MKDLIGQELSPGDRIAYARIGSGSNHGEMAVGRVLLLGSEPHPYRDNVEQHYIKVEWEYHGDPRFRSSRPSRSTVTKPENMVKL